MSDPYVKLMVENNIGYITFFHPDQNAMPAENLVQLEQAIIEAGKNEAIKVIVLQRGGDRTFCAGASFKELVAIKTPREGEQFFLGFANVINAMRECPKLIIGKVQGKAVGGGVGLAAATDYCLATKFASIKLSELSIGIGPFVIEPAVSRKIGKTALSQMAINAEVFFTSDWAKEKGLYAEVYESTEDLDKGIRVLAEKLSSYNPNALIEMKKMFWENTENWGALLQERAKISGSLVLSKFTKLALKRFN